MKVAMSWIITKVVIITLLQTSGRSGGWWGLRLSKIMKELEVGVTLG
jgi:hypothetical protein